MFDSKNMVYILTILEAIEKITIYCRKKEKGKRGQVIPITML
jgi:hypothetical protein